MERKGGLAISAVCKGVLPVLPQFGFPPQQFNDLLKVTPFKPAQRNRMIYWGEDEYFFQTAQRVSG